MSWAAFRETSRIEDIAYCLLGIFDVNMPLLYGEGKKAFIRLQQEIMKGTHDFSLFAWFVYFYQEHLYQNSLRQLRYLLHFLIYKDILISFLRGVLESASPPQPTKFDEFGSYLVSWTKDTSPLKGLLADSPRLFAHSGSVVMHKRFIDSDVWVQNPPIFTNGGIQIQLPCLPIWTMEGAYWWRYPDIEQPRVGLIANLLCKIGEDGSDSIGIPLVSWGHYKYGRRDKLVLLKDEQYRPLQETQMRRCLRGAFVKSELRPELRDGDILIRRMVRRGVRRTHCDYDSLRTEHTTSEELIRPRIDGTSTRILAYFWSKSKTPNDMRDFAVVLGKVGVNEFPLAARPLYVGFRALVGKDKTTFAGLMAELVGEQILKVPLGEAKWTYEDGVDAVDIVIKSERVSCVHQGKHISVDVIDMDLRSRELNVKTTVTS